MPASQVGPVSSAKKAVETHAPAAKNPQRQHRRLRRVLVLSGLLSLCAASGSYHLRSLPELTALPTQPVAVVRISPTSDHHPFGPARFGETLFIDTHGTVINKNATDGQLHAETLVTADLISWTEENEIIEITKAGVARKSLARDELYGGPAAQSTSRNIFWFNSGHRGATGYEYSMQETNKKRAIIPAYIGTVTICDETAYAIVDVLTTNNAPATAAAGDNPIQYIWDEATGGQVAINPGSAFDLTTRPTVCHNDVLYLPTLVRQNDQPKQLALVRITTTGQRLPDIIFESSHIDLDDGNLYTYATEIYNSRLWWITSTGLVLSSTLDGTEMRTEMQLTGVGKSGVYIESASFKNGILAVAIQGPKRNIQILVHDFNTKTDIIPRQTIDWDLHNRLGISSIAWFPGPR